MENNGMYLSSVEERQNVFLKKVYLWMALGLLVTAIAAFAVASSTTLMRYIVLNPVAAIALFVVEIGIVFFLSGRIETLSKNAALALFFLYSAVTGVTFSTLVVAYAGTNILTLSFFTASVVFGAAAAYGSVTEKSIKGWGGWLSMALISLIVVSLINIFLGSSRLEMLISGAGVVIFSLLTAWDSQKLMDMNRNCGPYMSDDEMAKLSIMGALDLYLDFVNIFLYLLRFFSRAQSRNN